MLKNLGLDDLIDQVPGGLGGVLDNVTGGLTGSTGGTGGLGLPRVAPGGATREAEALDPFDLAAHGLDPGIGTMLLQGVAEVR